MSHPDHLQSGRPRNTNVMSTSKPTSNTITNESKPKESADPSAVEAAFRIRNQKKEPLTFTVYDLKEHDPDRAEDEHLFSFKMLDDAKAGMRSFMDVFIPMIIYDDDSPGSAVTTLSNNGRSLACTLSGRLLIRFCIQERELKDERAAKK
jgi:hypothetical protein